MKIKQYLLTVLNNKEIIDLLPDRRVYFLHANNPTKDLYIEYEIINEYGADYSENKEDYTTFIVQIDIFSTGDYTTLESTVKKVMIENGFNRDMAADLYEEKTGLRHKAMRFSIDLKTSEN